MYLIRMCKEKLQYSSRGTGIASKQPVLHLCLKAQQECYVPGVMVSTQGLCLFIFALGVVCFILLFKDRISYSPIWAYRPLPPYLTCQLRTSCILIFFFFRKIVSLEEFPFSSIFLDILLALKYVMFLEGELDVFSCIFEPPDNF